MKQAPLPKVVQSGNIDDGYIEWQMSKAIYELAEIDLEIRILHDEMERRLTIVMPPARERDCAREGPNPPRPWQRILRRWRRK